MGRHKATYYIQNKDCFHNWGEWIIADMKVIKRCWLCGDVLTKANFLKELPKQEIKLVPVKDEHLNMWGF